MPRVASLQQLRLLLNERLAEAGYVTSAVELPPQSLATGVLRIQLTGGRLAAMRALGDTPPVPRNALAMREGGLLNLRDLEHSLETLERLAGGTPAFRIEPADMASSSVVAIAREPGPVWRSTFTLDNSAPRDFGGWRLGASTSWDQPLGLADQLSLRLDVTARQGASESSLRSMQWSYSLPWRRHLFSLSGSLGAHRRPVQGLTTRFSAHGRSSSVSARWHWTMRRTVASRWAPWLGASLARGRNYIDDVELVLQRRHSRAWEAGVSGWWRAGGREWSVDVEQGIALRRNELADLGIESADPPHTRRAQLAVRSGLRNAPLGLQSHSLRLAWFQVRNPADGVDMAVIGSRGSPRGFDARALLSGNRQRSVAQDLGFAALRVGGALLQPYVGLDVAAVDGPSSRAAWLAGAASGVRAVAGHFTADLGLSTPLRKPTGLNASPYVVHVQFSINP